VTLCGSARFGPALDFCCERLTVERGAIVFAPCPVRPAEAAASRAVLAEVQRAKIARSDAVLVVDVGGCAGADAEEEAAFADGLGKRVLRLSRDFPEWHAEALGLSGAAAREPGGPGR
jgi:hypothetical protein